MLKYLRDLRDAGVMSFKIEGRAKSAYYQAMVAGIYARVLRDWKTITKTEINKLYRDLENKIVSRGFTTGFILGGKGEQDTENPHRKIDWQFCGVVGPQEKDAPNKIVVKVHNEIRLGDELEIVLPFYEIKKMKVKKMWDAKNGAEITEAHGGAGGKNVILELNGGVLEFSVIRRRVGK